MAQIPLSTQAPVSYGRILNAGTVQVKSTPGAALSLNVNSVGTAGATLTLYDVNQTGTLGTVVVGAPVITGTIATPLNVSLGPPNAGLKFNSGLVVVSTGTVDATIGFR